MACPVDCRVIGLEQTKERNDETCMRTPMDTDDRIPSALLTVQQVWGHEIMKPNILSKVIYIVLFGFFASPFLLVGLLAGAIWISLKTGWWWAEKFGNL